jgi:hypothetical protein
MDAIALQTLRQEILDDCRVAVEASRKAHDRYGRQDEVGYEACAHQLARMFNVIEQMALRVVKVFENNIDDEQGWHSALLKRLALRIEGVRPALFPTELKLPLAELKAFRHVVVHAYDLELDPAKLQLVLGYAATVAERLPRLAEQFVADVAAEQGLGDRPK